MGAMQKLIEAEYELYNTLEGSKSTFSNGNYTKKDTLMGKYHIPEEAVVEAHNEGWIIDVCAPCFKRLPHPVPISERKTKFGEHIPPVGYTLADLSGVPAPVLYGQIAPASEKEDTLGEIISPLRKELRWKDIYPDILGTDEQHEKERLQKNYSPQARISNAIKVIEGADLSNMLYLEYLKEKKYLENGLFVAKEILDAIHAKRWELVFKQGPGLSEEQLEKFAALYSDDNDVGVSSTRIATPSQKLAKIESYRKTLEKYGLLKALEPAKEGEAISSSPIHYTIDKDAIDSIMKISLGDLPKGWIEVK